jgi:hypothetical protein
MINAKKLFFFKFIITINISENKNGKYIHFISVSLILDVFMNRRLKIFCINFLDSIDEKLCPGYSRWTRKSLEVKKSYEA